MRIKTVNGIIAFFILVMPQFVFGQLTLKGHICDSETSIGIPYCSVIIKSIEQGTMTNESGYFEITLPNSCSEKQPIEISSLGYDPLHTELIDILNLDTIFLKSKFFDIQEVVIKGSQSKKYKLGVKRSASSNGSYSFCTKQISQMALYIPNSKGITGYISAISFRINKNIGVPNSPFRLRVFEKTDTTDAPGNDLLHQSVIIQGGENGGWVTSDVDSLHILFPSNGLFVGLEWLYNYSYINKKGVECYNHSIDLTGTINEQRTWIRSLAKNWNKWVLFDRQPAHNIMIEIIVKGN